MSKRRLIVVLLGIYALGLAMLMLAYYTARDFAPTYFALYIGGMSLIVFGGQAAIRRFRATSL